MSNQDGLADIGVTGLATMGRNLARNFASRGLRVAVHNRSVEKTQELLGEHGSEGEFLAASTLRDLVRSMRRPRRIVVMVKAGDPTDAVIDELTPLLETGDIIVDAGNAHYFDTRRREALLRKHGIRFVGAGVSGGEEGALRGPSIMPGGDAAAYAELAPVLEAIAARVDGVSCCAHIGPDGAGHYVKMVHNGIEYADMQLIAEAYDLLRSGLRASPHELAGIFATWSSSTELDSYLIEITARVLDRTDRDTGLPLIDIVRDEAGQKGTGGWTIESALSLGVPTTTIAASVFARTLSGAVTQRRAVREAVANAAKRPGSRGHGGDRASFVDDVRRALYAAKVIAYAQGFDLIRVASEEYEWAINLATVATVWRGGCIIRARLLERVREAYQADPALPTLLVSEYFRASLLKSQQAWRRVISHAVLDGIPVPAFSATLAYFDTLRAERLPTALIQGQRDLFGAHTYRRIDREGVFHLDWADPGSQRSAATSGPRVTMNRLHRA